MSTDTLNSLPENKDTGWDAVRRIEAVRRDIESSLPVELLARRHTDPDQLARDQAEIERAAAVLRHAEPALETWTDPPPRIAAKTSPVWLLIGALWLSSALLTVGAVVAIAAFVG